MDNYVDFNGIGNVPSNLNDIFGPPYPQVLTNFGVTTIKIEPSFRVAETVEKGWGREIVFANNNEYCGKFLKFKAGAKFSMHFHIEKRETFFVSEGVVELHWFDLTNATPCSKRLGVGQIVDIPRNCPHRIHALENATIIEVSTPHKDSDSYRIAPGDSQKQTT